MIEKHKRTMFSVTMKRGLKMNMTAENAYLIEYCMTYSSVTRKPEELKLLA